jgi:hypothetical protein
MVRAILADQKTQTRRVVKGFEKCGHGRPAFLGMRDGVAVFGDSIPDDPVPIEVKCPYGRVGDRLWVRESWGVSRVYDELPPREVNPGAKVAYAVDRPKGVRIRPSIHMPRWASRITLEITAVRVERVQKITEQDAITEGVEHVSIADVPRQAAWDHRQDFSRLWDALNAKRGFAWATNPWVWVVAFRRLA